MSYRKWIINVALVFIIILLIYGIINYKIDWYNYWKADEQVPFQIDSHSRILKLRHISKNLDRYKGFVIGGSKAGALDTYLISKYEGGEFYNLTVSWGCFEDYLAYIKYIAENTTAEKIILHLSSREVLLYSKEDSPASITPSKFDDIKEAFNFLFVNPQQVIQDKYISKNVNFMPNGESTFDRENAGIEELGNKYFENEVLLKYNQFLNMLFNPESIPYLEAVEQNINALKEIIEICSVHNVKLEVVIGPTFISELYEFEGQGYWNYLQNIYSSIGAWDFSGFNDVNLNPYNFVNYKHYNKAVGTKMVNIMYGKEQMDGFGKYVDSNNFLEYISEREDKYYEYQKEFEETGTVKLFDKTDKSYIK